jgi:hypothetical protein
VADNAPVEKANTKNSALNEARTDGLMSFIAEGFILESIPFCCLGEGIYLKQVKLKVKLSS